MKTLVQHSYYSLTNAALPLAAENTAHACLGRPAGGTPWPSPRPHRNPLNSWRRSKAESVMHCDEIFSLLVSVMQMHLPCKPSLSQSPRCFAIVQRACELRTGMTFASTEEHYARKRLHPGIGTRCGLTSWRSWRWYVASNPMLDDVVQLKGRGSQ